MKLSSGRRRLLALALAPVAAVAVTAALASSSSPLRQLSSDPFTNGSSPHRTQVEPDSYAFGSTIVTTFQSGRFYDGGSSDVGFATSTDGGSSWTNGFLPSLTQFSTPTGAYGRAGDPSVAYDPKHDVWMISTMGVAPGDDIEVSRSLDGGLSWQAPVVINSGDYTDKPW